MSAEENKAVVRREIEEMFNQGQPRRSRGESTPQTTSATSLRSGTHGVWRPPSNSPPTTAKPSPTFRPL